MGGYFMVALQISGWGPSNTRCGAKLVTSTHALQPQLERAGNGSPVHAPACGFPAKI